MLTLLAAVSDQGELLGGGELEVRVECVSLWLERALAGGRAGVGDEGE